MMKTELGSETLDTYVQIDMANPTRRFYDLQVCGNLKLCAPSEYTLHIFHVTGSVSLVSY